MHIYLYIIKKVLCLSGPAPDSIITFNIVSLAEASWSFWQETGQYPVVLWQENIDILPYPYPHAYCQSHS